MQLVATTLGHTVIGSVYYVQECIASLLRAHPVGGLETMKKLANHQREIMNAVMVNEILEVVKERSIAGFNSTNKIEYAHLKSWRPFMDQEGEPHSGVITIKNTFESQGYTFCEGSILREQRYQSCFSLTWN